MRSNQTYTIVQYVPDLDRQEGINLGVLLVDNSSRKVFARFSNDYSRVLKNLEHGNKWFIELALEQLEARVNREMEQEHGIEGLRKFAAKRSNNVRLTPLMPTYGLDCEEEVQRLFDDLVGEPYRQQRKQRVGIKLRKGLISLGVLELFDQKPEPVSLPRYNFVMQPDLGIRRDTYHLITAARFDDAERSLELAGKHALEGRALKKNLGMHMVVVADFGDQPDDFYDVIKEDLLQADTSLYRMDRLESFAHHYRLH